MGTGGARSLPKHLCNKLGYDKVLEVVIRSEPVPAPAPIKSPRYLRPATKSSSCCASNIAGRQKYQAIKKGLITPNEYYILSEAIDRADLP